mmetsp:Transcript_12978/g.51950  ORF Transcript_12978/g.51950 Transcript_12978/m.51950 type:complete len:382 (-) Transcript_12978:68-1213(-)|eukprot:CAMPEP_0185702534 /NCGR_PEP_ID=MMETSP1164-20130828/12172_1 /TAXON_ID=1104430 /ORGANISM="Chrysoreinhardia sp, Strain CCMP2950" /LENGTH=381 /DNA_ID=CAMNT_0028369757 /DNA_START=258 /DNA_END=1403 /DNA_ORIENTATION=+
MGVVHVEESAAAEARATRTWIVEALGIALAEAPESCEEEEDLASSLADGVALCAVARKVLGARAFEDANHSKKKKPSPGTSSSCLGPFERRENVKRFLGACRRAGLREHELFETVDLDLEGSRCAATGRRATNTRAVARCLARLSTCDAALPGTPRLDLTPGGTATFSANGGSTSRIVPTPPPPPATPKLLRDQRTPPTPVPANAKASARTGAKVRGTYVAIAREEARLAAAQRKEHAGPVMTTRACDDPPRDDDDDDDDDTVGAARPVAGSADEDAAAGSCASSSEVVATEVPRAAIRPAAVEFCKTRCVVHWPPQRAGDERFDAIVAALPDDDFKAQVRELCAAPGAKLELEYKPVSGCVVQSEDADGNCCQMELEWGS